MIYTFTKEISPDKLNKELIIGCPHYVDLGTTFNEDDEMIVSVTTHQELNSTELETLNLIVTIHDPFDLEAIARAKIKKSIVGFQDTMEEFATENVLLGITQSGKTKLIADTLSSVMFYGQSGALYEVIQALSEIEITSEMSPFLTEPRREEYIQKFQTLIASL